MLGQWDRAGVHERGGVRAGARLRWSWLLVVLCLGAGLRGDALATGFYMDDYQQLALLRGEFPIQRPAWDVFWFGPRDARERARLIDFGFDPWWTAEQHRIAMFRPLSSALLWLDLQAFGDEALGYHLHAFAWWALLIAASWALLQRLLPPASAALALLLFALSAAHDVPLCWIANRSTLVAASCGVLALLAQVHALTRSAPRWLWLAALGWCLSLSAGEYAFGVLAYAVAHAWLAPRAIEERTNRQGAENAKLETERGRGSSIRWTAVLAAGVPACAYLALRAALGHGVVASGLYVSPGDVRYLATAPGRWLALAGELVLGLPAAHFWSGAPLRDQLLGSGLFTPASWQRLPDWPGVHGAIGALALGLGVVGLAWLERRRAPEYPHLRWLLAGSALGLLSAGAALPESRLLVAPALGTSAALAVFVVRALAVLRVRLQPALLCAVAGIMLVHGAHASYAAFANAQGRRQRAEATRRFAFRAPIPERAAGLDVVLVSAGDFSTAGALPWIRWLHGAALPRSYRRLSGAFAPHLLRRVDARTLELDVIGSARGGFVGSLYRPLNQPLTPGQRISLRGMEVQVLALRDGDVARWLVRFDRPLESPSFVWLHAFRGGLRRFVPPPVGQRALLPMPAAAWQ